jgi:pimeloyl-ACP methyl ester carboxylesterase
VLDWGSSGPPLLFLSGMYSTGHSFDGFAEKFTAKHHVYAITRRGFGLSSLLPLTDENYNSDRLADDMLAVMDALHIQKPVIASHSVAGQELSSIGTRHPGKGGWSDIFGGAFLLFLRRSGDTGHPGGWDNGTPQYGPLVRSPAKHGPMARADHGNPGRTRQSRSVAEGHRREGHRYGKAAGRAEPVRPCRQQDRNRSPPIWRCARADPCGSSPCRTSARPTATAPIPSGSRQTPLRAPTTSRRPLPTRGWCGSSMAVIYLALQRGTG